MTQRYATIITDDDGREIVSAIGAFEGAPPRPRLGRVEPVASGVLIGMVRDAAAGFCFEQPGVDANAVALAMARLKARAGAARRAGAPGPAATARPKRAKRARVAKRKSRARKPARSVPKTGLAACANGAGAMDQVDG